MTSTKEPPLEIVDAFLSRFGHDLGGSIRTDQGGELARLLALSDLVLRKHNYVLEPTGADSPLQNGSVEIYNDKLAIRARTLLYGSGLPAKYWSSALMHSVYLHNRMVHATRHKTPFEGLYGVKPDIGDLKLFGSRVCVKQSGLEIWVSWSQNDIAVGIVPQDQTLEYTLFGIFSVVWVCGV